MNTDRSKLAIAGLQWTLGMVVLAESLRLALASEEHFIETHPLPHHLGAALAWMEATAAGGLLVYMAPVLVVLIDRARKV
jgi:hypothetical protein